MQLTDILKPDCIKVPLTATDKQSAIYELVELLAARGRCSDAEALKRAVWQRETTRTTGIGHGLAIPHGKSACCDRLIMAVGKPAQPIDFNSIDKRPVNLIFLLASPPDLTGPHITALARVSRLGIKDDFRAAIISAPDAQTIYDLIAKQDGVAV